MKPVKAIAPQHWMTAPKSKAIMEALGGAKHALYVGGCVRNALLKEEVTDIDIATKHHPEEVIAKLEQADIKAIPTGIDHGTITAVIDKEHFEITTLRKDVETDGRRAVIAFADTWEEDAQRRDFTMNTLLADGEGNIFDPTNKGLKDLEARCVIFVGDPQTRIQEDLLRILRFFRFHGTYGAGEADAAALKACAEAASQIPELSRERITTEFIKILSLDDPTPTLDLMFENGVLSEFKTDLTDLKHLCEFQTRYNLGFIASRLYILADSDTSRIEKMGEILLLPKVFKKDIQAIDKIIKLPALKAEHEVKVAIYKYGRVTTAQALMIELVQDRVMNGYAPKALDIIQNWDIPNFPISGEDLMKEGYTEGAELGAELAKREEAWLDAGFND